MMEEVGETKHFKEAVLTEASLSEVTATDLSGHLLQTDLPAETRLIQIKSYILWKKS